MKRHKQSLAGHQSFILYATLTNSLCTQCTTISAKKFKLTSEIMLLLVAFYWGKVILEFCEKRATEKWNQTAYQTHRMLNFKK
jgi:hypothetical protein